MDQKKIVELASFHAAYQASVTDPAMAGWSADWWKAGMRWTVHPDGTEGADWDGPIDDLSFQTGEDEVVYADESDYLTHDDTD